MMYLCSTCLQGPSKVSELPVEQQEMLYTLTGHPLSLLDQAKQLLACPKHRSRDSGWPSLFQAQALTFIL